MALGSRVLVLQMNRLGEENKVEKGTLEVTREGGDCVLSKGHRGRKKGQVGGRSGASYKVSKEEGAGRE